MTFDIERVKRKTLAKYPPFGSIAAELLYEETEKISRSASDGKTLFYNPGYMAALTAEEQIFVFAHELCHIAFRHIRRSRGKDLQVWKAATDAVVNQMLKRDGLPIPAGGIDYPEAADYDAEQYYEILLRQKLEIEMVEGRMQKQEGAPDPDGGRGNGAPGEDDHSMWEDAAQQQEEEEAEREEELLEQLEKIRELAAQMPEDMDADSLEQLLQEDEKKDGDREKESEGLVSKKVSKAGNAFNPDIRQVGVIGNAVPVLDWRLILRDTVNIAVDWSFSNAVLEDGIVRPVLQDMPWPETEIVLDTSWSVDEDLLRSFLRECRHILQHSKMKAGCFDTVFYGFEEIRTEEDIDNMTFHGGGGTDFNAAVEAFSMRVDNRIIFTDGEAPMPDKPLDAVWLVIGEKEIEPEGGKVIHITPEQLAKLTGVSPAQEDAT